MTRWRSPAVVLAVGLLSISCSSAPADLLESRSGGEGTSEAADRNAFDNSARNLSNEQRRRFEVGDSFFTQNWVTAPASTDQRDGLGPLFNAQACSSCHLHDGRGDADGPEPGLLFRLSVSDGDVLAHDPVYGDQIQDRSILGVDPEATVRRLYVDVEGQYDDGTPYTLRKPLHEFDDFAYGDISVDVMVSARLAPPVFGVGLLEAIPEQRILSLSDPDDVDGDGISGRPNYVIDLTDGETVLGRFGWKANVATVADQVAAAFNGDLGITSSVLPDDNCSEPQVECAAAVNGGTPEISDERLSDVAFYNRTLAVPARRNLDSPDVVAGARVFESLECGSCHTPRHETGTHEIDALVEQVIYPFTDLLLHDMGPDLGDGRPDGEASGTEWRTPPLWGIGLTETVNGHLNFLHDGRARSLEEAILWHGGEAQGARDGFTALDAAQRQQLIDFLNSL